MYTLLSYGSRSEIVESCKSIASDVAKGIVEVEDIDEQLFGQRLLTG